VVDADPLPIAGFRAAFALPVLALAIWAQGGFGRVRPADALRRPYMWAAAGFYALMVMSFVAAAKYTTAANAIFLEYTAPIWVSLLSWRLLRERMGIFDCVAVAGCTVGMALFLGEQVSTEARLGNLYGVVAGIGFAGLPLCLRLDQRTAGRSDIAAVSPVWAMWLGNALTVLVCLPAMIQAPPAGAADWAVLAALGMLQIGFAYVLFAAGIRRVRAVEATLMAEIEPVLNPIWVAIGTGEMPSHAAIAGGAIILASVAVQAASASGSASASASASAEEV
jgi:drug/metabolite transporter (DMT)-like permease